MPNFCRLSLALVLVTVPPLAAQRVGDRLPTDFALESLDGTVTSLAATRGQARIVNVWATWCRPCVAELPSLAAMTDSLRGDGVAVYAVALNRRSDVERFLARLPAAPPVYLEREAFPRAWGRWALPVTWVIGPDDRLLHIHYGAARWDDPAVLRELRTMFAEAR